MPRPLAEQVVVVTGASSGIGRTTVREFSARGARVVAAARAFEALQDLGEDCRRDGGSEVLPVATDVREYDEVAALAAAAVERLGRIDTWVNCAAVHEYAWFEDGSPEEFDAVLRTNVMGQVHGAYAALPHLIGNDAGGVLIGVSSVEGVRAVPLQAPYVTSKFALRGFYDTVRMEMTARHPDVKVTTILPASIDTPIFDHALTKLPRMPMPPKPLYAPETVARAIVHVAAHPRGRREVPVGGSAAMFLLGQRFAPSLMDFLLSRRNGMADQQQTELPVVETDNLLGTAGPHTTRSRRLESSSKVSSVKERSYATELVWQHPMAKRAVVAVGLAGLGTASGLAGRLTSRRT